MRRDKTLSINPEQKENINLQNIKKTVTTIEKEKNIKPLKVVLDKENQTEKIKFPQVDYISRENSLLMPIYGKDVYTHMKTFEENYIPADFMQRHYRISEVRTKMIDWMLEVLNVFKSDEQTFFLAVYLMDYYLYKTTSMIKNEDIHLIGITCMYIASKFEDVIPLRMNSVVNKIGHEVFSENKIKQSERLIISTIGAENLVTTSILEFIKTYFWDFVFNNFDIVKKNNLEPTIEEFEKRAIYYSKLILHFECFYKYSLSLKAVACILNSFDHSVMKRKISKENEKILYDWCRFLIDESTYPSELIGEIYQKIKDYVKIYEASTIINKNLNN